MRSRTLLALFLAELGFSCTSAQEGDDESPDGLEATDAAIESVISEYRDLRS